MIYSDSIIIVCVYLPIIYDSTVKIKIKNNNKIFLFYSRYDYNVKKSH